MKRSYKFTEDAKITLLEALIKEIVVDYNETKDRLIAKMTLNIPEVGHFANREKSLHFYKKDSILKIQL